MYRMVYSFPTRLYRLIVVLAGGALYALAGINDAIASAIRRAATAVVGQVWAMARSPDASDWLVFTGVAMLFTGLALWSLSLALVVVGSLGLVAGVAYYLASYFLQNKEQ